MSPTLWIWFWGFFLGASLVLFALVALVVSIRAGGEARRLLAGAERTTAETDAEHR